MGTAANVKMGVCNVTFNSVSLGYTSGGVKCTFATESKEIEVDQEDVPIGEIITKQSFQVEVPMAEYNLAILEDLLPGATLVTDGTDSTKKKLVLSGAAGGNLLESAAELLLEPAGESTDNFNVTVHHACPVPNIEFAFEKENVRVYNVTFKALVGTNGFVTFGDTTATA